jgi:hypothetical protein
MFVLNIDELFSRGARTLSHIISTTTTIATTTTPPPPPPYPQTCHKCYHCRNYCHPSTHTRPHTHLHLAHLGHDLRKNATGCKPPMSWE